MPSKEEREKRKQLRSSANEQAKADFENSLPVRSDIFKKLFNFLDVELGEKGCDHTLVLTEGFLKQLGITDTEAVKQWLRGHGGYCDCEVLANVEEKFEGNNFLL